MARSWSGSTGTGAASAAAPVLLDVPSRSRRFWPAAAAVLALAAFNLTFRIADTAITEWDESLYGLTAAEMLESGDWIVTRLNGEVDYTTITKPPLIVWLTALSFNALGITPVALRLVSLTSAWLTVLALMLWARRAFGNTIAVLAGAVLSMTFGFMFVHSGRTGNTDALFTLLTTLTAIVLFTSFSRPWWRVALGVLLAGLFLLRGPGMLMPLAMVVLVEAWHRPAPRRGPALGIAALVFTIPVAAWAFARWRADGWQFLAQVWSVDLVTRTLSSFEGHGGGPLYYLDILQRYQYEWLIAAVVSVALFPPKRWRPREWLTTASHHPVCIVITSWAAVTFLVPTLLRTKLSWYLDPFYPVFAVLIALVLRHALAQSTAASRPRRIALLVVLVLAVGTAEGKMLYQAYRRDKNNVLQGLLERERDAVRGRTIYRAGWNHAETFVATRMVGARVAMIEQPAGFADVAAVGDFLVGPPGLEDGRLMKVSEGAGEALYRKVR